MVSYRSQTVKYLQTNGPATFAELPAKDKVTVPMRKEGVRKFNPKVGGSPSASSRAGRLTAVYYLENESDPGDVLHEWVQANPSVIERASPRAFIQAVNNVGRRFADVSTEVAREAYSEAEWEDSFGGSSGGVSSGEDSHSTKRMLEDLDPSEVFNNNE